MTDYIWYEVWYGMDGIYMTAVNVIFVIFFTRRSIIEYNKMIHKTQHPKRRTGK